MAETAPSVPVIRTYLMAKTAAWAGFLAAASLHGQKPSGNAGSQKWPRPLPGLVLHGRGVGSLTLHGRGVGRLSLGDGRLGLHGCCRGVGDHGWEKRRGVGRRRCEQTKG